MCAVAADSVGKGLIDSCEVVGELREPGAEAIFEGARETDGVAFIEAFLDDALDGAEFAPMSWQTFAKIALGIDTASEALDDLAKAEALLMGIRPSVRYFHSSQYINDLANGEICLSVAWSGDTLQARDRALEAGKGVDIAFAVPKEGALRSFDMLAIPVDAPHPENAHRFINFLLRADVAAGFTEFRKYPTGNLASEALVPLELRRDPIIYPSPEIVARFLPHQAESLAYARYANRAWTRVRTGL